MTPRTASHPVRQASRSHPGLAWPGPLLKAATLCALCALWGLCVAAGAAAAPTPMPTPAPGPATQAVAPPAGLGALFYTPAQRQRITLARRGQPSAEAGHTGGAVRLDGLVRSSRGATVAFINGQEAGTHLAHNGAAVNVQAQGLRLDERTHLAVGQSVVPGAGNAPVDLVPAGSVVRGRQPKAEPLAAPGGLSLRRSTTGPARP